MIRPAIMSPVGGGSNGTGQETQQRTPRQAGDGVEQPKILGVHGIGKLGSPVGMFNSIISASERSLKYFTKARMELPCAEIIISLPACNAGKIEPCQYGTTRFRVSCRDSVDGMSPDAKEAYRGSRRGWRASSHCNSGGRTA